VNPTKTRLPFTVESVTDILNFLPYPFLIATVSGGTLVQSFLNRQFLDEIGYTLDEIPTIDDWFRLAYPDINYRLSIQTSWMKMIREAQKEGEKHVTTHARIFTKKNGYQWFEVKSSLRASGYQFVSFVNIDGVIKKEEELGKANDNKNKMLSILSHDLRSAMINLFSLANLAATKTLSATEFETYALHVKERSAIALELLDTTVQWTKTNFEGIQLVKQSIDVNAIIKNILTSDDSHQKKNIHITLSLHPEIKPHADSGILTIIIRNIISNAIKFTPPGGTVELKSWRSENRYFLSVIDSGTGMSLNLIAGILSDQYSPTTGTLREKGSGIGLTLCRDLLRKIDGILTIESVMGAGTDVRIELPLKVQ
jgi:signal transduction histidine kinase